MSLDLRQFRDLIISPTLKYLEMYSPQAEQLVLGTLFQESRATYLMQLGKGPALGLLQMEPETHNDIWYNYLKFHPKLFKKMRHLLSLEAIEELKVSGAPGSDELVYNLRYAVAMCRVHYWRKPESLPKPNDFVGLAHYWKKHYNTYLGAGSEEEFLKNFPALLYE